MPELPRPDPGPHEEVVDGGAGHPELPPAFGPRSEHDDSDELAPVDQAVDRVLLHAEHDGHLRHRHPLRRLGHGGQRRLPRRRAEESGVRRIVVAMAVLLAACGGGGSSPGGGGGTSPSAGAAAGELSEPACNQVGVRQGIPGDATFTARLTSTGTRAGTFTVTVDFVRSGDNARVSSQRQIVDSLSPGTSAAISIDARWQNDGRWDAAGSRLACNPRPVDVA